MQQQWSDSGDGGGQRPAAIFVCAVVILMLGMSTVLLRAGSRVQVGGTVVAVDDEIAVRAAVQGLARTLDSTQIRITAGSHETITSVAELGMQVDVARTVADITDDGGDTGRFLGGTGAETALVPAFSTAPARTLLTVTRDLSASALSSRFVVEDARRRPSGDELVTPSIDGQRVTVGALRAALVAAVEARARSGDAGRIEVVVEPEVVPPAVADDDLAATAERLADLASGLVTIADGDTPLVAVDGRDLLGWIALEITKDTAGVSVLISADPERTPSDVVAALRANDVTATDARIVVDDAVLAPPSRSDPEDPERFTGSVSVVPSVVGREIDVDATFARAVADASPGDVTVAAAVVTSAPRFSTADAEQAGALEPISSFTTFFTAGQSRSKNILRIAEIVDGVQVLPGDAFELNHFVGRRTRAKGFFEGGAIADGEFITAVGGGVSQFATTFFNAAWFSGARIDRYQAHSFYFSRYPAGREATIDFPTVDLEITNDTPYPIVVTTEGRPGSVTATFWSRPYWNVETITGSRRSTSRGFNINVTRVRTAPGGEPERRTFSTSYKVQ